MQKIYLEVENLSHRPEVLDEIERLKCSTVLDIGGSWNSWLGDKVTHVFDLFDPNSERGMTNTTGKNYHWFSGDMNDYADWFQVLNYVDAHGKFDFVNCTHTLEDLAYPITVLKMMPRIAKAGFIAVPSKYWELDRRMLFRGGVHHRWIFDNDNNHLMLYPKINLIEFMNSYNTNPSIAEFGNYELRMLWWDTLDYSIANNDYLGPTFEHVVNMYETLMRPE